MKTVKCSTRSKKNNQKRILAMLPAQPTSLHCVDCHVWMMGADNREQAGWKVQSRLGTSGSLQGRCRRSIISLLSLVPADRPHRLFLPLDILLARYNPPAVARSARPPYMDARPLELSVQREYSVPVSQAMKAIAKFWSLHSRPKASIALYSGC